MMKKLIYIGLFIVALGTTAKAQNYEVFKRFMQEYTTGWGEGYRQPKGNTMEFTQQVGVAAPEFHFDKQLNSKALKGKFVVITFWSTWCGSCRELAHDLDTVLFREMTPYENVQVIGVDCHERISLKEAKKWWKDSGISYPAVYGDAANACYEALHGNHPATLLIDDKGIIRSRWDGWSPEVSEMVKFAIWALQVQPTEPCDIERVKAFMNDGEYMKALYLLELMPEDIQYATLKYKCMLAVSELSATRYFRTIQEKYANDPRYPKAMEEIVLAIAGSDSQSEGILENGMAALDVLLINRSIRTYQLREAFGIIYCRYGECCKKAGIISLKNSIRMATEDGADAQTIERLEKELEAFEK